MESTRRYVVVEEVDEVLTCQDTEDLVNKLKEDKIPV